MGELITGISTILSFMTTLFFWGGLVLIIAMLRKLMKDVADMKKTVAALEETMIQIPRSELQARTEHD
jgi:hypothetical protein